MVEKLREIADALALSTNGEIRSIGEALSHLANHFDSTATEIAADVSTGEDASTGDESSSEGTTATVVSIAGKSKK